MILFPVSSVGPWLTFEIQLPQDDFHLLAWVLGREVSCDQLPPLKDTYHLRGLPDQQCLLEGIEYGHENTCVPALWEFLYGHSVGKLHQATLKTLSNYCIVGVIHQGKVLFRLTSAIPYLLATRKDILYFVRGKFLSQVVTKIFP